MGGGGKEELELDGPIRCLIRWRLHHPCLCGIREVLGCRVKPSNASAGGVV